MQRENSVDDVYTNKQRLRPHFELCVQVDKPVDENLPHLRVYINLLQNGLGVWHVLGFHAPHPQIDWIGVVYERTFIERLEKVFLLENLDQSLVWIEFLHLQRSCEHVNNLIFSHFAQISANWSGQLCSCSTFCLLISVHQNVRQGRLLLEVQEHILSLAAFWLARAELGNRVDRHLFVRSEWRKLTFLVCSAISHPFRSLLRQS